MPGAHFDGRGPRRRRRFAARHDDAHVRAAAVRRVRMRSAAASVEHYRRGRRPGFPADLRCAVGMNDPHTDGRGDPVDLVAQCGFVQYGQDSAGAARCRSEWSSGHRARAASRCRQSPNEDLWTTPDLWTTRGCIRQNPAATAKALPDKRDDPRQGGRRRGSSCISPGGSG